MRTAVPILLTLMLAVPAPAGSAPGARTIELRADTVILQDGGAVVDARGHVRITVGRDRAAAGRAVYAVRQRRILLSGGVTIRSPGGDLEASSAAIGLTPMSTIDTIQAAGQVTLQARQRVVRAERLTYTVTSGTVTAQRGVEVFFPPDLIASGEDLVMTRRELVTLQGAARVQTRDGYIQGDRIDVAEPDQVARVRGHVVGVFQETRVTAVAATFYGSEERAVFRGRVQVIRPAGTIQAEVVTIYYRQRRIVAEGETTIRVEDEAPREPRP